MRALRSIRNFITLLGYSGVTLMLGLVATPLLLKFLGPERFGAVRAMTDWFGYLALLELGLSGSLLPRLARANSRGDQPELAHTLTLGVRLYIRIALISIVVGLFMAYFLPTMTEGSESLVGELRRGGLILLAQYLLLPTVPFRLLLDASQESYRIHGLLLLQSVLMTSLTILFAYLGFSIPGQCLATVIGMLPSTVILTWISVRRHPGLLQQCFGEAPRKEVDALFHVSKKHNLIFDVVGKVGLSTDSILIAYFLGLEKVTFVHLTTRLFQIVQGQLQGFGGASWAGLADIYAKEQYSLFRERVLEITQVISIFCIATLVPLAAFNSHFVQLWVGSENFAGNFLTALAALNAAVIALISFWAWCFTGTGNIRFLLPSWIAWAVLNLVVSVVCTKLLGFMGPLLGTGIANCLFLFWKTPVLMQRVFAIPVKQTARAVLGPFKMGIPFIALNVGAAQLLSASYWLPLQLVFMGGMFLGLSWIFLLEEEARKRWKARFLGR